MSTAHGKFICGSGVLGAMAAADANVTAIVGVFTTTDVQEI